MVLTSVIARFNGWHSGEYSEEQAKDNWSRRHYSVYEERSVGSTGMVSDVSVLAFGGNAFVRQHQWHTAHALIHSIYEIARHRPVLGLGYGAKEKFISSSASCNILWQS